MLNISFPGNYPFIFFANFLLCFWKRVFPVTTSAFSWQNSVSLWSASFCTPRPNFPVTPGISWPPTLHSSPLEWKPHPFWALVLEGLVGLCAKCWVTSVMSDSVRPHRRQPTRLPRPWDSPGKNTGVGFHFLLQCMKVKSESEVTQSCRTLSNPTDCSPPGSPIPGILQARTLEWVAVSFSNARKCKVKVKLLSRVRLLATPWTAAHQAPPIHGIFQARVLEWGAIAFSGLGMNRMLNF